MWGYEINPAGHAQHFQLDRWGQYSLYDTPTGYVTGYTRDANGFAVQVTTSGGRIDAYGYSGAFLTSVAPYAKDETFYQFGPYGQMTQMSGANQPTQVFALGVRGHTDSLIVNGVTKARFYADALGRDTLVTDAQSDTTRYAYDSATGNRNRATVSPGGRFRTTVFDGEGRDSVVHTSGAGTQTTFYDLQNRVVSSSDGVHPPTIYTYDGLYLKQVTDPKNQVYTTTYNAVGWPVTRTDPTNRVATTTYNGYGLAATVTNRNGLRASYVYDNMGRVTTVHRQAVANEPDSLETFTYTVFNDIVTATNATATDVTYYNRAGGWVDSTITTYAGGHSFKRFYHRDTRGRVDSVGVSTGGGVTQFDPYARRLFFDSRTGLVDSLHLNATTVSFRYNVLNQIDSVVFPGGVVRSDTYTAFHTLATTAWTGLGLYRGYGYDSAARINEVDHSTAVNGSVEFYGYTSLGQLTQHQTGFWSDTLVKCINGQGYGCGLHRNFTLQQQASFAFDSASNLESVTVGSADTSGTVKPGNRLSAWGSLAFAGDSQGNRVTTTLNSSQTRFTWSADGRLLVDSSATGKRTYEYNTAGQLVKRSTNGSADRYYLWDGGELLAVLDGAANKRLAEFVPYPGAQDQPLARITGTPGATMVHFFAQDGLGNIIAQFSGSTTEQSLSYDPWGATTVSSSTGDTTQLRWKGLLFEDGAGLYYVRSRWYDPVTRRFISPDPSGIGAGVNQYAYGNGDPINGSDHSGLFDDYSTDSTPPNPADSSNTSQDSTSCCAATTTDPAFLFGVSSSIFEGPVGGTSAAGVYVSFNGFLPSDIGVWSSTGGGTGSDVNAGPTIGGTNNTSSINGPSVEVAAAIPPVQATVSSNQDGTTVMVSTAETPGAHLAVTTGVTASAPKVVSYLYQQATRGLAYLQQQAAQVYQQVQDGMVQWWIQTSNPMGALAPDN
jgi:RHS repeat-associated protein